MRISRAGFALALLVAAVGFLGVRIYRDYEARKHSYCDVCQRPIHKGSKVVALIDGKEEEFCCPACVLILIQQNDGNVEVTELTDFETGKPLAPQEAWLVVGSEVNLCVQEKPLVGSKSEVGYLEFDRCEPSILAFSSKQKAEQFAAEHGGTVMRWQELARVKQGSVSVGEHQH